MFLLDPQGEHPWHTPRQLVCPCYHRIQWPDAKVVFRLFLLLWVDAFILEALEELWSPKYLLDLVMCCTCEMILAKPVAATGIMKFHRSSHICILTLDLDLLSTVLVSSRKSFWISSTRKDSKKTTFRPTSPVLLLTMDIFQLIKFSSKMDSLGSIWKPLSSPT